MTEPMNQLEAELSGMQPIPIPGDLANRIELELKKPANRNSPWPDRFLLTAMASGALAACVLVGVLLVEFSESNYPAAPAGTLAVAPYSNPATASPLAFARGNPNWVDLLK